MSGKLSLLIEVSLDEKEVSSATSEVEPIGNVKLGDKVPSTDAVDREIHIALTKAGESLSSIRTKIWPNLIDNENKSFNVVKANILPVAVVSLCEREWLSEKSQLSFVETIETQGRFGNIPGYNKGQNKDKQIFRGWYNNHIDVAIERYELEIGDNKRKIEIDRAQYVLEKLAIHENLVRYFCCEIVLEEENQKEFAYLATELCLCSVEDLLDPKSNKINTDLKQTILSLLTAKGILYQATRGLDYLHQNNFVHRNIKPSNFLIQEIQSTSVSYAIKLTGFRLTRQLDPKKKETNTGPITSELWRSPESKAGLDLKCSLDVYVLGCFFYYVLTGTGDQKKPRHPFTLESDILKEDHEIYQSTWEPDNIKDKEAIELMKRMIKFQEDQRPILSLVLQDHYFQTSKDIYPIYGAKKPGICVVFNQENYWNDQWLSSLPGNAKDCADLKECFENLGFDTEDHKNKTASEIEIEMKCLAKRDYTDYGCLVICLLSHGVENAIFGCDGHLVNIYELEYLFSYKNCPTLYGKPKIFIVQACQGALSQNQTGITFPKFPSGPYVKSIVSSDPRKMLTINENQQVKDGPTNGNPPIMDFITITSSIPGFLSWGLPDQGSFFIQALCDKFREFLSSTDNSTNELDLETILRGENGVQAKVNTKIKASHLNQTIRSEVSLSKRIKFYKK